MKSNSNKSIILILLALLLAAGVIVINYYRTYIASNTEGKGLIYVYGSDSYADLLDKVNGCGAVRDFDSFRKAAKGMRLQEGFRPGRYEFTAGKSNKYLVRMLALGWQTPQNVTINGYVRSMERMAALVCSKFEADSAEFVRTFSDSSIRDSLGFNEANYISLIIPNTYQFYWTTTPRAFLERMKKEYDAFWTEERMAGADAIGLSRDEVVTLASIVVEESKYEPEQPRIAGVYMNRLKRGMPLQADPTVLFALGEPRPKRVLKKHLEVDSPYNTYRYRGLPPGPITIPTIKAIDAVLNYERHNYLYFCARETFDGQHNFAVSLTEHNANAARYQRALSRISSR